MRKLYFFLAILSISLWSCPLFTTPTFDQDEAAYRQSALEMKKNHSYLGVTLEGQPSYDKPPLYFWTVVGVSQILDQKDELSTISAKLPSLIATYLSAFLACLFWWKSYALLRQKMSQSGLPLDPKKQLQSPLLPALFLGWAFLPIGGSSVAILDPLLTLFLSPVLLFLAYSYLRDDGQIKHFSFFSSILMGSCMALACMLKGPIGILIPGFSLFIHELISFLLEEKKDFFFKSFFIRFLSCLKIFSPMFIISLSISFLFYYGLYRYGQKEFIYQFFVVQNFQRGLNPFDGHKGSFFYYPAVLLLGGFVLIPSLLVGLITSLKNQWIRSHYKIWGYLLSWCLAILIFYSMIATKLPHYIWPVWIALATLMPVVSLFGSTYSAYQVIFWITPFLISIALLSGGILLAQIVPFLKLDYRAYAVIDTMWPFPIHIQWTIAFCGFIALFSTFYSIYLVKKKKIHEFKSIVAISSLNSTLVFSICIGLFPFVKNVYWLPFVRLSQYVESQIKKDGGTFATIGINSSTVTSSFHLFYVPQYPTKETSPFEKGVTFILLPVWLENRCKEYGYEVARKDSYLTVCRSASATTKSRSLN